MAAWEINAKYDFFFLNKEHIFEVQFTNQPQ